MYLQLKHTRDDEWHTINYVTAKAEQDRGNERRIRKSYISKTQATERDGRGLDVGDVDKTTGGAGLGPGPSTSTQGFGSAGPTSSMYKLPERPMNGTGTTGTKNNWRPPARNAMDIE